MMTVAKTQPRSDMSQPESFPRLTSSHCAVEEYAASVGTELSPANAEAALWRRVLTLKQLDTLVQGFANPAFLAWLPVPADAGGHWCAWILRGIHKYPFILHDSIRETRGT